MFVNDVKNDTNAFKKFLSILFKSETVVGSIVKALGGTSKIWYTNPIVPLYAAFSSQ